MFSTLGHFRVSKDRPLIVYLIYQLRNSRFIPLSSRISLRLNWSQMLFDPLTHHSMTGMLMIVSPRKRKISAMICLNVLTITILTLFLLSKKIPIISLTLLLLKTTNTTARSTRNRENCLRIGIRKFLQNRKEITSLAPSREPNVSLLILTTILKQLKKICNFWMPLQ